MALVNTFLPGGSENFLIGQNVPKYVSTPAGKACLSPPEGVALPGLHRASMWDPLLREAALGAFARARLRVQSCKLPSRQFYTQQYTPEPFLPLRACLVLACTALAHSHPFACSFQLAYVTCNYRRGGRHLVGIACFPTAGPLAPVRCPAATAAPASATRGSWWACRARRHVARRRWRRAAGRRRRHIRRCRQRRWWRRSWRR